MSYVICHVSCVICHVSYVICHMSCVICHVSYVMCHMSCVICHVSYVMSCHVMSCHLQTTKRNVALLHFSHHVVTFVIKIYKKIRVQFTREIDKAN